MMQYRGACKLEHGMEQLFFGLNFLEQNLLCSVSIAILLFDQYDSTFS